MSSISVLLLVLFGCVLLSGVAHAQSSSTDLTSALENTGIVAPMMCNAPLNSYQLQVVNGLWYATTATLVLQCTGCSNTTIEVDIGFLNISSLINIAAPNSCLITNRFCRILMYVSNVPNGSSIIEQALVSQIESTCGVVPPNDYTAGCDWWNFACQMTNGEWYHYGPALTLYQAFFFIAGSLGTISFLIFESSTRQFRLAEVSKASAGTQGLDQMTFASAVQVNFQTNTIAPSLERPIGSFTGAAAGTYPSMHGGSNAGTSNYATSPQQSYAHDPSTASGNNATQQALVQYQPPPPPPSSASQNIRHRGGSRPSEKEFAVGSLIHSISVNPNQQS